MELLKIIEAKLSVGENQQNDIVTLDDVPCGQLSPPFADTIPMDVEFSPIPFINGFVRNIFYREIRLTVRAWRCITEFITKRDFSDVSSRICLQILFLYSKADPVELEARGNAYNALFENRVSPFLDGFRAEKMSDEETKKIKERLSLPVIIKAMNLCLEEVIGQHFDEANFSSAVESMNVYKGRVQFQLRGVTLCDGIFINQAGICNVSGSPANNEADLITICGHETVHYLARKFSNNYNFSTPNAGRTDDGPRFDPFIPGKCLELGRLFELKLLGMQPNWFTSYPAAASRFLELVSNTSTTLPLAIGGGLQERPVPSASFGIDPWIEWQWDMC